MKKLILAAFCMAIAISLPRQTFAQNKMAPRKGISAEDKKAIIEIFKGVDPKMYRLQFNNSKEVYGSKKVSMNEVTQVSKIRNPGGENGYIALVVRDDGVMYIVAVTKSNITSVLGQEKVNQLNAIMAKYQR